jgi:hypothetical protein
MDTVSFCSLSTGTLLLYIVNINFRLQETYHGSGGLSPLFTANSRFHVEFLVVKMTFSFNLIPLLFLSEEQPVEACELAKKSSVRKHKPLNTKVLSSCFKF